MVETVEQLCNQNYCCSLVASEKLRPVKKDSASVNTEHATTGKRDFTSVLATNKETMERHVKDIHFSAKDRYHSIFSEAASPETQGYILFNEHGFRNKRFPALSPLNSNFMAVVTYDGRNWLYEGSK